MLRIGLRRSACLVAGLAALVVAGCGGDDSESSSGGSGRGSSTAPKSNEPYEAVLSANFLANAPRQEYVRIMRLATERGELAGKVNLKVVLSGATVQAQAQSIDNIARKRPDLLIVLPSSGTGLTAAIERACAAGVTVVAFDSVVTAPCAPSVAPRFSDYSERLGSWMAEQADEGVIFLDEGTPGVPAVEEVVNGYRKGIEETNPSIKIVPFESRVSAAGIKAAVANLIPAYRDELVGIAGIAMAKSAMAAVREAGLDPVAQSTVTGSNEDLAECLNRGQDCLFGAVTMAQGAEAMKLGVELLEGTADKSVRRVEPTPTWYGNAGAPTRYPDVEPEEIAIGRNVFPDLPGSLLQPFSTPWLPLTAEEAAGR